MKTVLRDTDFPAYQSARYTFVRELQDQMQTTTSSIMRCFEMSIGPYVLTNIVATSKNRISAYIRKTEGSDVLMERITVNFEGRVVDFTRFYRRSR